jgi:hypothetical protein
VAFRAGRSRRQRAQGPMLWFWKNFRHKKNPRKNFAFLTQNTAKTFSQKLDHSIRF